MTPTNTHPGPVARGLRRTFLLRAAIGLLSALLAAPAPALAQGVIHFNVGPITPAQYVVNDDGTNLQQLTPSPQGGGPSSFETAQDNYPGRLYLNLQFGNLPSGGIYANTWVWSDATGQSKAVTNFNGPVYYGSVIPGPRWSNDGQDSFVSFGLLNYTTGQVSIYRAWVSATEIASPTYQPVSPLDLGTPRLQYVAQWTNNNGVSYWWSHDGSRFYYVDPRNTTLIRVKIVGVGVTMDDDQIVYQSAVGLAELRVGPPVDLQNPDRYLVAAMFGGTGQGILAVDLVASTSWTLATATVTKNGKNSFDRVRGPCFSPDGSHVAFGAVRTDSTQTPYFGVYTVPFAGGPLTKVTELEGSKNSSNVLTVEVWNAP
jgi:hypothetical protein